MARTIKILFSIGFIFIVLGLIMNFALGFKQDKQEVSKRMKLVNSAYETFKKEAKSFTTTRDNLYDNVLSELYFETLNLTINNCLEELEHYEQQLDEIEKIALDLQKNCQDIYFPDKQANNKCQTFAISYEQMVNYFVNDIKQVNDNIIKYNTYNQENNTGIAPVQEYSTTKKYIDFNKDNKYEGKEDF